MATDSPAAGAPLIREARESDYDALCRLWGQLDRLHAEARPDYFRVPEGSPRSLRAVSLVLSRDDRTILVAELQGQVAGMVTVIAHDTPESPLMLSRRRAHVPELVVDDGARRRGLGRALMAAAEAWARAQGARQLVLTVWEGNPAAEAFYLRLGYGPVNRVLGLDL